MGDKTKKLQIADIKKKMTIKNFLNPSTLISDIKAVSLALKQKTGQTKGPKPKKKSFVIYNSKTKKFRTGSNPGKNEKRAKIDLRAGTIDFGD